MNQLTTEIAVVSAGSAGMAAAVAAAEKGAKVIVLEKAATMGGSGNMARGPFAVESKLQRMRKIPLTRADVFKRHMDYTHWRVDARLVSQYINKSSSTIEWLEKMGVEFIDVQSHNQNFEFTWHIIKGPLIPREMPGTGIIMVKCLAERAKTLGVNILFRTPARRLLKKDERIIGVIAEDEMTGEDVQVNAGAVIIATGGFGDNPEMIKKYTGYDIPQGIVPGLTGDGIRMAWEAGAARSEMTMHTVAGANGLHELITASYTFGQPNLMVNLKGERFMDEAILQTTPFGANAIAGQPQRTAFMIFDEDTKQHYLQNGLDFPPGILVADPLLTIEDFDKEVQQAIEQGNRDVFIEDTLEDLAGKTGLPLSSLQQTVNEYNHFCETGRDTVFYKDSRFLKVVKRPRFYAAKFSIANALGSLGGIKINYKTEVLDKNQEAIPGLYAAGADANSIYGDTYIFWLPGNTLGFALNSGRMAGENAAEYVRRGPTS
jgi:fumarate reductase flavoprotein subunit